MKFLRTNTREYKRLGKGRKKKQKWRRPRGRHNKIREKIRGKQVRPSIGFKKSKEVSKIKKISNLKELEKIKKGDEIIIAHIGKKKKKEIIEKAKEKSIKIIN